MVWTFGEHERGWENCASWEVVNGIASVNVETRDMWAVTLVLRWL
jgi:hypothetical protein